MNNKSGFVTPNTQEAIDALNNSIGSGKRFKYIESSNYLYLKSGHLGCCSEKENIPYLREVDIEFFVLMCHMTLNGTR